MSTSLYSGQTLASGQQLTSPGGTTALVLQPDGQLQLLVNNTLIWSPPIDPTKTGADQNVLALLGNGVLALFPSMQTAELAIQEQSSYSGTLWATAYMGHQFIPPNPSLELMDTGQVAINSAVVGAIWTFPPQPSFAAALSLPTTMAEGGMLTAGQQLSSPDGSTVLSLQTNGELALFVNGDPIWAANNTTIAPDASAYVLIMQGDGNLALYPSQTAAQTGQNALWSTATNVPSGFTPIVSVQNSQTIAISKVMQNVPYQTWSCPATPNPATQFTLKVDDANGNNIYTADYAYGESSTQSTATVSPTPRRRSLVSQKWADDRYKPAASVVPGPNTAQEYLEVTKAAFEFIKSNNVVSISNASTAVLNSADTNALDYTGAKNGQSGTFRFYGTLWPTDIVIFDVEVGLAGYYGAAPPPNVMQGLYLPWIYSLVTACDVNFPYSMNASASVGTAVNTGTATNMIPEVIVILKLNASTILDEHELALQFKANGKTGFSLISTTSS